MLNSGCDERTINPFEDNIGLYSVYGAIGVNENPNYIRISDLSSPFPKDSTQMDGVTVIFENLTKGTHSILRDTIVEFSGNFTHNFIVNENLEPASTYLLTVENPEGSQTTSTATTPGLAEVELTLKVDDAMMEGECIIHTDPDSEPDMSDPKYCEDQLVPCTGDLLFSFGNVHAPERIQMEVGFEHDNQMHWERIGKVKRLAFNENQDGMYLSITTRQLLVEVFPPPNLGEPRVNPLFLSPEVDCHELDFNRVYVRYIHFGPEWGAAGVAENQPVNLLESADVEGGLGFFGAYRQASFSYSIEMTE